METTAATVARPASDRSGNQPRKPSVRICEAAAGGGAPAAAAEWALDPPPGTPARARPGMGNGGGRRLRWHLLGFAAALVLPVLGFAVGVAAEYGAAQRTRLEGEAVGVARDLEAAVERELSALLAAAQTLAASPALLTHDFAAFERQADEVAAARGVAVLLRAPSGRQLVNTAAPRGTPLPERTAEGENPEAKRATAAGAFYVSNLFEGGLTRRPFLRVVVPAHLHERKGRRGGASGRSTWPSRPSACNGCSPTPSCPPAGSPPWSTAPAPSWPAATGTRRSSASR